MVRVKSTIQNTWLFSDLNSAEIEGLCHIAQTQNFNKGQDIVSAGKNNDSLWIVGEGQVSIYPNGVPIAVAKLESGDIFGEMSWLDGFPAGSTVRVTSPTCTLVRIPFQRLNDVLAASPDLHVQVLRKFAINLSHRLR